MSREQAVTIADIEGPWVEQRFESGLIERCKRGWETPVSQLTSDLLATYLRQKIGLALVVPEIRERLARGHVDGTELYDEELAEALRSATGEKSK